MLYKFYIEYETGRQNDRTEKIIVAENALEAISLLIEGEKKHRSKEWDKHPTGMISVRARI